MAIISIVPYLRQRWHERFSQSTIQTIPAFPGESPSELAATGAVFIAGRAIPIVGVAQIIQTSFDVMQYFDRKFPEAKREIYEGTMDAWRHHMGITNEPYYSPESFGPEGHGKFKSVGYYRGQGAHPHEFV